MKQCIDNGRKGGTQGQLHLVKAHKKLLKADSGLQYETPIYIQFWDRAVAQAVSPWPLTA
jgi:hypothetical protein